MENCPKCSALGDFVCGGCSSVWYCSEAHQREDWKSHGRVCKKLQKLSKSVKLEVGGAKKVKVLTNGDSDIRIDMQDHVSLHYKCTYTNGVVIENTRYGAPINTQVGTCADWLSKGLQSMFLNETSTFAVRMPSKETAVLFEIQVCGVTKKNKH